MLSALITALEIIGGGLVLAWLVYFAFGGFRG